MVSRGSTQRAADGHHLPLATGEHAPLVAASLGQPREQAENIVHREDVTAARIGRRTHDNYMQLLKRVSGIASFITLGISLRLSLKRSTVCRMNNRCLL
jgi:hypothetical protein